MSSGRQSYEEVAGKPAHWWMELFKMCYEQTPGTLPYYRFIAYPDGGALLDQPLQLVEAFRTIRDEAIGISMRDMKNG